MTVVIFPSDHFIYPDERFVEIVSLAVSATKWLTDRLITIGVQLNREERDLGLIQVGGDLGWAQDIGFARSIHLWKNR